MEYPALWLGRKLSQDAQYHPPFPLVTQGGLLLLWLTHNSSFPSALSLGSFPSRGSKAYIRSTQNLEKGSRSRGGAHQLLLVSNIM